MDLVHEAPGARGGGDLRHLDLGVGEPDFPALSVAKRAAEAAIALGEIEFSSGLRAVGKEMGVGLVIGSVAGVISGAVAWGLHGNVWMGFVLFASMVVTMAAADAPRSPLTTAARRPAPKRSMQVAV